MSRGAVIITQPQAQTPCQGMAEPAQAGRAGDQLEAVRKSLDFRTASSWPPALTFFSVLSLLVTTMYPGWTNPTVHGTQYSTLERCLLPVMSPAPPVTAVSCLCPDVTGGDAPELVSAAVLGGVPHPPGYPSFCLVSQLCAQLPLGTMARRINFCTALLSSGAAALLHARHVCRYWSPPCM